tara:strand:- start:149 stop:655 length:507 start_codon:yes stop_codon:yes gene_type:complete
MASILKVNEIQHTGGTSALTTDTSGRVFRSNIPHFIAGISSVAGVDYTSWTKFPFIKQTHAGIPESSDFNDANNRYIAPVAGLYWFSWLARFDGVGGNYIQTEMRVNGTSVSKYRGLNGPASTTYHTIGSQGIIQLNATDYVEAWVTISGDTSVNLDNDANFHGYLIG